MALTKPTRVHVTTRCRRARFLTWRLPSPHMLTLPLGFVELISPRGAYQAHARSSHLQVSSSLSISVALTKPTHVHDTTRCRRAYFSNVGLPKPTRAHVTSRCRQVYLSAWRSHARHLSVIERIALTRPTRAHVTSSCVTY